jgi:hypothetical protein
MNLVLEYIQQSPVSWINKNIVHTEFTPGQEQVINDKSQYRFILAKRQAGKTFIISNEALYHAIKEPMSEIVIIAPTTASCNCNIHMILDLIKRSPYIKDCLLKVTRDALTFTNGSIIRTNIVRNFNDTGCRYKYIYIDEFYNVDRDIREVINYVMNYYPQAKILITGTPQILLEYEEDSRFHYHYMY